MGRLLQMGKPRLVLADDHELMLDGLRNLLAPYCDLVAAATDGHAALAAVQEHMPSLLVLDVALPILNGFEVARRVKQLIPATRILFVTMHNDRRYVEEALRIGAAGYVLKHSAATELIKAVQLALKDRYYVSSQIAPSHGAWHESNSPSGLFGGRLTPRQREVLQLISEGKTIKEMATILSVSVRTVEFHKNRIANELGIRTTAELTRYAIEYAIALDVQLR